MKNPITILLIAIFLFLVTVEAQKKMDRLIVYGDGFRFGVKEPDNWQGDIDNAAEMSANIIFYRKGHEATSPFGVIRIHVARKVDENTAEDLAYDMKGYKEKYPNVQFSELSVTHTKYKCFSKLFFISSEFYEYVTYLNPGEGTNYVLSVSLSKKEDEATAEELFAYRTIISSIIAFSDHPGPDTTTSENKNLGSKQTDFVTAMHLADDNLKSTEGEHYDEAFAKSCGPWLTGELSHCSSGLDSINLQPLWLLFRVSKSGTIEEALVAPDTKLGQCLKPVFKMRSYPNPPDSSWWVKMHIDIH